MSTEPAAHRINLRGPWHAIPCDQGWQPTGEPVRLRHPEDWPDFAQRCPGPVILQRTFHAPSNLDPHETVHVLLTGVQGHGVVRLNGVELGSFREADSTAEFELPLPLPFTNLLEIRVRRDQAGDAAGVCGTVALEIRQGTDASSKRR